MNHKGFTIIGIWHFSILTHNDAPQNSLKDSNANLKVKTTEEKGVGVHSLARNTSGVKGVCWSSEMKTRMNDKRVNYKYNFSQTKQQV
jgi:hypothetical protein